MMTKEEILAYFQDINAAYNECGRYDDLKRMLDELTEERPKKGKWIYCTIRGEKRPCCSECGEENGTIYEYRFCPNCGIEMTEDKE